MFYDVIYPKYNDNNIELGEKSLSHLETVNPFETIR